MPDDYDPNNPDHVLAKLRECVEDVDAMELRDDVSEAAQHDAAVSMAGLFTNLDDLASQGQLPRSWALPEVFVVRKNDELNPEIYVYADPEAADEGARLVDGTVDSEPLLAGAFNDAVRVSGQAPESEDRCGG